MNTDIPKLVGTFKEKGITVAFAESCTGGRLSADLTEVPGSSNVVKGSLVCYQVDAKRKILALANVTEETVVSEETVRAMALSAGDMLGATVTVSTTGYLDPSQEDGAHAYWGIYLPEHPTKEGPHFDCWCVYFDAQTTREENREFLLQMVYQGLEKLAEEFPTRSLSCPTN